MLRVRRDRPRPQVASVQVQALRRQALLGLSARGRARQMTDRQFGLVVLVAFVAAVVLAMLGIWGSP